MKKLLVLILAATMVLPLYACGAKESSKAPTESMESTESSEVEASAAEEDAYKEAERFETKGDYAKAAIAFGKIANYQDSRERSFANWEKVVNYNTIAAGQDHTVAIENVGTVVAVGVNDNGRCDVSGWSDIISIAAGGSHTVGLKADHTVVATGLKDLCQVSDWTDIVAISAGSSSTFGLKIDGTVVYNEVYEGALDKFDVDSWSDVVEVSAAVAKTGTIAYRSADGHVRVYANDDRYGQHRTGSWSNIEAVAAGGYGTIGVDHHGNVFVSGFEGSNNQSVYTVFYNSLKTEDWNDLIGVAAGQEHIVGLKPDGTLSALHYGQMAYEVGGFPNNTYKGEADVFGWTDIVAVAAADRQTIALKSDGTVLAAGDNSKGECDVSGWSNIKLPQ